MEHWAMIIGAILGSNVITAIITTRATRSKTEAEADDIGAEAMTKAISGSVDWAEAMRKDISDLRKRQDDLMQKYTDLMTKYQSVLEENHKLREEVRLLKDELRQYEREHGNS